MVYALLAASLGVSLLRMEPVPRAPGFACIPVPASRIVAPGQRATMHVYDFSSLQAIRHAQSHANNTYGQVVLDEEALKDRQFALHRYGSRVKLLSVKPSTHTDKYGGTSASLMAEVIGIGLIEPAEVLEKMPFMTVECPEEDELLPPPPVEADEEVLLASLTDAAALCESLDDVDSFKGPLSQETDRREGGWSLSGCVERVIELRGCGGASDGSRLVLSALAATAHLPGQQRLEAMAMAREQTAPRLVEWVETALQEESRRRLALKALYAAVQPAESDP